MIKGN